MAFAWTTSALIGSLLGLLSVAGCARTEVVSAPPVSPSVLPSGIAVSTPPVPRRTEASSWPPTPTGAARSTTPPLPVDPTGAGPSTTGSATASATDSATASATDSSTTDATTQGDLPHRVGSIEPILTALARAAADRNDSRWADRLSAKDLGFTAVSTMIYRNLSALRPTRIDFTATGLQRQVSAPRRQLLGSGAFAAQVLISWRLGGDQLDSEHLVWMTFVPDGTDGWRWAGTTDGPSEADPSALPLWWLEPITISRSDGNVVLAGTGMDGAAWLARAKLATANVVSRLASGSDGSTGPDRVWDGHLVVEIPTTQGQFEQTIGAPPGSDSQLAAVTFPDATDARLAPMRIMLNPEVMGAEPELGIDIVLTHETTHVATRSPASAAPLWLIEGYADYNAYASYPQAQASAEDGLYRAVRSSGAPKTPPGNGDFSPRAKHLNLTYAEAWQLCAYLAAHGGQGKLNSFYAAVDRSPDADVDAALHTVYGIGQSELMKRWDKAMTDAANG